MMNRLLLSIAAILAASCLFAQKHPDIYSKEISFTTENDAYLFNKADAYYTNGFFLHFSKATVKNGRKRIQGVEAGQMIFTPLIRLTRKPGDIDRPYSGFLYLKYNNTSFDRSDAVWQYGATLGAVGAISFGRDVQNWYHNLLNYGKFTGWGYEVQNAVGLDFHLNYARTLYQDGSWCKLMATGEAKIGSNFTNASTGMMVCLGKFSDNRHSALFNARVQERGADKGNRSELFFYAYPQVIWQGYNATIEGGLFSKGDAAAVLRTTSRWVFQQTLGACYAAGRFTTRVAYVYQTREAVSQTNPHWYGSLLVGYRIR